MKDKKIQFPIEDYKWACPTTFRNEKWYWDLSLWGAHDKTANISTTMTQHHYRINLNCYFWNPFNFELLVFNFSYSVSLEIISFFFPWRISYLSSWFSFLKKFSFFPFLFQTSINIENYAQINSFAKNIDFCTIKSW